MDNFYNLTIPWHKGTDGLDKWKEMRRRQKFARQRVEKGFAACDWWNVDGWIENILSAMLHEFANKTISYPGDRTYEDWVAEIHHYADLLEESAHEIDDNMYGDPAYESGVKKRKEFFQWFANNLGGLWD